MKKIKKIRNQKSSLLTIFKLGDRVKQTIYDPEDKTKKVYKGLILKIREDHITIHWDTVDGKPNRDPTDAFTIYNEEEIFNGDKYSSPIKKE